MLLLGTHPNGVYRARGSCSRCKGKYYFSRLYGFKSGRPVLSRDIPNYPLISRYTPSVKAQKKHQKMILMLVNFKCEVSYFV